MNLETDYLGLRLRTPLVPSASPLTGDLDNLRRLEDAGASAVVLPSVFEEQIMHRFNDPGWSLAHGIQPYPPALSYLPNAEHFASTPEDYLEKVRKASSALSIPVIASLSCATPGGWSEFARRIEEAGAAALELSIYYVPTDPEIGSMQVEDGYASIVVDVRRQVAIPLAGEARRRQIFRRGAAAHRDMERSAATEFFVSVPDGLHDRRWQLRRLQGATNLVAACAEPRHVPGIESVEERMNGFGQSRRR